MSRSFTSEAAELSWAADIARRAPSILNTQPWRWRVTDAALELWADRSRVLDTIDPDGRLLTLSCGVALHHARTALTAGGHSPRISRFPDPDRPDLLARITLQAGPAHVTTQREHARFTAIGQRRTDRRPFSPEPVAETTLNELRDSAAAEGAYLHVLWHDDIVALAVGAARAGEAELADPAYRHELHAWTNRPRFGGDGVPATTAPVVHARRVPLRDFTMAGAPGVAAEPVDTAAAYAVVWGDTDEPTAWLRAGEVMSAVMLDATAAGLALSPMTDLIEVESTRAVVRQMLANLGHPYAVLRIGHPQPNRAERTPRRPVNEVIEDATLLG
jgi:nitroreductase